MLYVLLSSSQERHGDPSAKTSNFMAAHPSVSPFATPMMPLESEEGISYDGEGSILHKTCLFQTVLETHPFPFLFCNFLCLSLVLQFASFWLSFSCQWLPN
jgi:hypothetical protein